MITDHAYDASWPRDDSNGCIATVVIRRGAGSDPWYEDARCGEPLAKHHRSEYPEDPVQPTGRHAGDDGDCPDYGSRYDPCPPGCALGSCVFGPAPKYPEQRLELVHPFID